MEHFAALVGIDWSDKKHDLCLVDLATGKREQLIINHTPEALDSVGHKTKDTLCWSKDRGRSRTVSRPADLRALEV